MVVLRYPRYVDEVQRRLPNGSLELMSIQEITCSSYSLSTLPPAATVCKSGFYGTCLATAREASRAKTQLAASGLYIGRGPLISNTADRLPGVSPIPPGGGGAHRLYLRTGVECCTPYSDGRR